MPGAATRRAAMTASPNTLDTLLLPFASGALAWPPNGRVLFMRARAGTGLQEIPVAAGLLVCEQSFKPYADALVAAGHPPVAPSAGECGFAVVLLLPPRQREEARALLAQALQRVAAGGVVVAAMANNEGARSGEADLERLAGAVQSGSKNKCRVFWAAANAERMDAALIEEWAALDAPRPIADGRFLSRPGLFAWSRIDAASALLASCLPGNLGGCGADLGAGFGYLAAEVLERCPAVTALDLYEAEGRGLELARLNLRRYVAANAQLRLDFLWHDVTRGLQAGRRYEFIVSNPPFHQGRADQPEIGRAFLVAAANALAPGGSFWLVANRHLPYEGVLGRTFRKVRPVCDALGFKVIEAIK